MPPEQPGFSATLELALVLAEVELWPPQTPVTAPPALPATERGEHVNLARAEVPSGTGGALG